MTKPRLDIVVVAGYKFVTAEQLFRLSPTRGNRKARDQALACFSRVIDRRLEVARIRRRA